MICIAFALLQSDPNKQTGTTQTTTNTKNENNTPEIKSIPSTVTFKDQLEYINNSKLLENTENKENK